MEEGVGVLGVTGVLRTSLLLDRADDFENSIVEDCHFCGLEQYRIM